MCGAVCMVLTGGKIFTSVGEPDCYILNELTACEFENGYPEVRDRGEVKRTLVIRVMLNGKRSERLWRFATCRRREGAVS